MHDDTSHLLIFINGLPFGQKAKEKSRDIVDPCPHSPARTERTGGKGKAISPRTPRKGFLMPADPSEKITHKLGLFQS